MVTTTWIDDNDNQTNSSKPPTANYTGALTRTFSVNPYPIIAGQLVVTLQDLSHGIATTLTTFLCANGYFFNTIPAGAKMPSGPS